MEKTLNIHVGSREHSSLTNALRVARDKFLENAKLFGEVAAAGGNGFVTAEAATALQKEFEFQAAEIRMIAGFFDHIDETVKVKAVVDDADDLDLENPYPEHSVNHKLWAQGMRRCIG